MSQSKVLLNVYSVHNYLGNCEGVVVGIFILNTWKIAFRRQTTRSFHPDFDVWTCHGCTNVKEILGITEAFPLCCSHTVKTYK